MISLDFVDRGSWESMRERHRRQEFGCPECRSDVIFRAGDRRRPHFAHKAVSDCPMSRESAELLEARAALYEWLKSKFGDAVSVEHRPAGVLLPRPIDCWVDRPGKPAVAYWIFDRNAKPAVRDAVLSAEKGGARWNFVFVARMRKPMPEDPGRLRLGPTEREFVRRSRYESIHSSRRTGSLHYVDGHERRLTSVRAVLLHEGPVHHGIVVASPMSDVTVHGDSGEFVHPGEHERRVRLVQERRRAEQERAEAERERAERERLRAWEEQRRAERQSTPTMEPAARRTDDEAAWSTATRTSWREEARSLFASPVRIRPPVPCELCGTATPDADQIVFDGRTGTCKCRRCMYG